MKAHISQEYVTEMCEQLSALRAENAKLSALRAENAKLSARVAELEALIPAIVNPMRWTFGLPPLSIQELESGARKEQT